MTRLVAIGVALSLLAGCGGDDSSGGGAGTNQAGGAGQVPGSQVDKQLEEALSKQGAPRTTVNCPDPMVVRVGVAVNCETAEGAYVTFIFSNENGDIDESSVKRKKTL